jgi:hypothetical protein
LNKGGVVNARKHIYYITVSDVQHLARENIGRDLNPIELVKVIDRVLDRIQWLDVVEEAIVHETQPA